LFWLFHELYGMGTEFMEAYGRLESGTFAVNDECILFWIIFTDVSVSKY